jgi:crotonobetainyl-CoA:carnitine CoA-transferase CaiB-like acyl-CoA transferase
MVPEYDRNGLIRERSGSFLKGIAPSNVYRCSDGEFMIGGNGDTVFARLAQAMDRPYLATDPRYAKHVARGENQIELDALINKWTGQRTIAQVEARMIAFSVPAGKVYRAPEMLADPHFQARQAIVDVETERFGTLKMQNVVPRLSGTPSSIRSPAPSIVGQHNDEIYGGLLGISASEQAAMKAAGTI